MDRRFTPPKRVTSPTCGLPPPCNQALKVTLDVLGKGVASKGSKKFPRYSNTHKDYPDYNPLVFNSCEHVFLTFYICLVFRLPAILHNLFVAKSNVVELPNVCLAAENQILH